jgi:hypothetical protein
MFARLIATALLWGMRFGLAWFVAYEYLSVVGEKLTNVSHAFTAI